jgi:hypothetical protein
MATEESEAVAAINRRQSSEMTKGPRCQKESDRASNEAGVALDDESAKRSRNTGSPGCRSRRLRV